MCDPNEPKSSPPPIGEPLPDDEALRVEPITRSEIDKIFDDLANMPSLEEMAASLGLTVEELDDI